MQDKRPVAPTDSTGALALLLVALCAGLFATSLVAAQKSKSGKKPNAASITAGKKVYEQFKCANCHAISGIGGKSGPDLSNEGASSKHSPQWLESEIKDPKSHKADSAMPAFGDKIHGAALSDLAAFMCSLKKK